MIQSLFRVSLPVLGFVFCSLLTLAISFHYMSIIGSGPDEGNHFSMAEFHSKELRLANWQDFPYGTTRGHSYHLFSPVAYVAYSPFIWWTGLQGNQARKIHGRYGGLVYGFLQFVVTLLICRLLLHNFWTALLVCSAINMYVQVRYLHSYINADSFAILSSTLAGYFLLRLLKAKDLSLSLTTLCGIAAGLVLLGKYNGFVAAISLSGVFIYTVFRLKPGLRVGARHFGLYASLVLILSYWFHESVYFELAGRSVLAGDQHLHLMYSTFSGRSYGTALDNPPGIFEIDWGMAFSTQLNRWESTLGTLVGSLHRFTQVPFWYLVVTVSLAGSSLIGWVCWFFTKTRVLEDVRGVAGLLIGAIF